MAGLRYSFSVIGIFGICIAILVPRIKALQVMQPEMVEEEMDQPPIFLE
jgi:hypothetical protein